MVRNVAMQDADAAREEDMMYGHGSMTREELDDKYPNRPHNHSQTLPFHDLYLDLFDPLNDNKKKPTGPAAARRKAGPHVQSKNPHEVRRAIIERFISRWRKNVGNDIYPVIRLLVPEKDRDRAMYGLKEATIAKLLVKILKIDKNSEDGHNLQHWKQPGIKAASAMAGDFAGRCFEVISKRPMRTAPGDMTIAEVNELLDKLSVAQKEENQMPIMQEFYNRMNAKELMWLIRMILRQMKIGASEKTIFDVWHPDAENLFNISSSLRRVCWELYDPNVRLEGESRSISLMQCFQPQLAAFQDKSSFEKMVSKMKPTEQDPVFWIEEKLDGERMQLHMMKDDSIPGGFRFGFWSRKAKDYTYLYGNGFQDDQAALTRHIQQAFDPRVNNIILDGEMITWDTIIDAFVPFGTLKTAALAAQKDPYGEGKRPLYKVFDCLYLNDKDLTPYTMRDRRKALESSVTSVDKRLEIHAYSEAQDATEIEPKLRDIVAEKSEGLVLKNPRSAYRLNERNDDWVKVKPEYMDEFGEALDCVVIGGYYGSGHRGGNLSSFLCGLRLDDHQLTPGMNPQKCYSFFKVGGGFAAEDFQAIRHQTEGKWHRFDPKNPPNDWFELGGGPLLYEKPDVWIKPAESIVLEVKAASVHHTPQFRAGITLRFPRFKKLRNDKDWKSALTYDEFIALRARAEDERKEKKFKFEQSRRKPSNKKRKKDIVIQGHDSAVKGPYAGPVTKVFDGLKFEIMTDQKKPKKSKADVKQLVEANGGTVVASHKDPETILVVDTGNIPVRSIQKDDNRNMIRPSWLYDCVKQSEADFGRPSLLLPFERRHMFHVMSAEEGQYDDNTDANGDSYALDVTPEDLLKLFGNMAKSEDDVDPDELRHQLSEHDNGIDRRPGCMFNMARAYLADISTEMRRIFEFAGGTIVDDVEDQCITHVVLGSSSPREQELRKVMSARRRPARIISEDWIKRSWEERTLLDEERSSTTISHLERPIAYSVQALRSRLCALDP